ncbi:MAG: hypothetical protein K6T85_04640 [Gorillibacterium sp.]|nr:hypothetical protein [Gorillibacterium sp.]
MTKSNDEYFIIIKTENDIVVETVKNAFSHISKLIKEKKASSSHFEMITKREFNRRLDEMLLVY